MKVNQFKSKGQIGKSEIFRFIIVGGVAVVFLIFSHESHEYTQMEKTLNSRSAIVITAYK